jgi:hypothetical protein
MKRLIYLALILGALATNTRAQLRIFDLSQRTAEDMVAALVGSGVVVTNIVYTGATNASGLFCSGRAAVGFDNGIVLSSGSATNVAPPNDSASATTANDLPGDADLESLIPGFTTFDAAVLEFDFIPSGDIVQFDYVFGSEEYNEFVNSPFNDVFGFFVNGVNYALIPGTATPVSINNVNNGNAPANQIAAGPCNNCEFYVDNAAAPFPRATQLDGLTTVLTMIAPVTPGTLNHMKIAIADAGDPILDSAVFIKAGSLSSGVASNCVTRDARFWFTHPRPESAGCVNLHDALATEMRVSCDVVGLGFLNLPSGFRNNDNVMDAEDALLESLGLFYRSKQRTGEVGGTQNLGNRASKLCRQRKRLAIELIAAIANVRAFQMDPSACSYFDGVTTTNFPASLLDDARSTAAGENVEDIVATTALLRKFNNSGRTNDFPAGMVECSPAPQAGLRKESRDPTLNATCPGFNDACTAAEALYFRQKKSKGLFSPAKLTRSVDLTRYTDDLASPTCGSGGAEAVWKISPNVGQPGRQFTVDTFGSNFDTLLSVFTGECTNLLEVACSDDTTNSQSRVTFTTDGTNTYFIVVEGAGGALGKLKLQVSSP